MAQQILFIEGRREGYGIDQIRNTMTVGELIDFLSELDEDAKVYLNNDNGYTYGSITDWSIEVKHVVTCPDCNEVVIIGEYDDYECECGANLDYLD